MFNINLQSMCQTGVELLYVLKAFDKQVAVWSIDPFGISRTTAKSCSNSLRNFFITY